jgi:hypothetical protein
VSTLINSLNELRDELLDEQEPIENQDNLGIAIQVQLDPGRLTDFSSEELSELSPTQRIFYDALVYSETIFELYSEIAFDGLESIFYNKIGDDIDKLKTVLHDNKSPISELFDKAYSLVDELFDIKPNDNWVMRNLDKNPYEILSDDVIKGIESIENKIYEMQNQVDKLAFEKALNMARQIS